MSITDKLKLSKVKSLLISFYFIILTAENLFEFAIISYVRYALIIVCVVFVFQGGWVLTKRTGIYFIIYVLTAIVNILTTGNNSFSNIIFTIVYFYLYNLLIDEDLSEEYLFWSTIACSIMVSLSILITGIGSPVLQDVSNNFISVLLLMPCIVYYVRTDVKEINSSILPAFFVWFACLLALGRGGILASSILFLGIIYLKLFGKEYLRLGSLSKKKRQIIIFVASFLIIFAALFSSEFISNVFLQRFQEFGFYGTGRTAMWAEYFDESLKSFKAFLFGTDFDNLFHMIRYRNNIHNSFINIHATNGLIMLGYVFFYMGVGYKKIIDRKKWTTLLCITAFFLRAFTDRIFGGGSSGTLIFFFVLWVDQFISKYEKAIDN